MSDKIDQRIVEMSFENHKFEKGIVQSKNSLKEFNNALSKSTASKDFSGLEKSVVSLSGSFSVLEQIGVGALRRIGEQAVNAGTKLFKSLSVDQLTAGWSKYEEKIDAVQTLISAGYDMDSVRKEMDQLMWFADETSYSFSDMANNMGKFVASGVDLPTATRAMQGIATWAAQSGKNSQAASIAMFNLSQAISMGYVDTLNWRSVMGQNMNTVMFKQVAIGVAEATGAIKEGQVTIQNFDSNLKSKWFTNDVLLKTLEQYSGYAEKVREVQEEMNFDTATQAMDYMGQHAEEYGEVLNQIGNAAFKASQESKKFSDSITATMDAVSSGWLRTYEIIFGELDEAKANFTALTEILWTVFASGAENRNVMLRWLKEMGGISNVFQGLKNVAVGMLSVLRPIAKAFDQIFPPKTREQWLGITEAFKNFTEGLIVTDEIAAKIQRTFAGVFAVVDIGWRVLKLLGDAAFEIAKIFLPLSGGILDASASLGDFLVNINKTLKSSGLFQYAILAIKVGASLLRGTIADLIKVIGDFVVGLWNAEAPLEYLKNAGSQFFSGLLEKIKMVTNWISDKFAKAVSDISGIFDGVFDDSTPGIWTTMLGILKEVVDFIGGAAVVGFQNFGETVKKLDFKKIASFVVGGTLLIFVKQISDLTGAMTGFTNSLTGAVKGFTKKFLGAKTTSMIRDMAYAFGILAASLWVLSTIPTKDLVKSFIGLAGAIAILVGAYALLQSMSVKASLAMKDSKMVKTSFGLTGFAAALLIMATALKVISNIAPSQVVIATAVMAGMVGLMAAYQLLVSRIPAETKVPMGLISMSASLLVLVGVLGLLKLFTINELETSLAKMTVILLVIGGIQGMFGLAARIGGGNKLTSNMLGVALGIAAMVGVMKLLSIISPRTITQGVGNLALIVLLLAGIETIMGLAGRLGGGEKLRSNILKTQLGLVAMLALIKILDTMEQATINRGIVNLAKMSGLIVGIELLTATAARISNGAKVQKILASVAFAMIAFASIIAILGSIKDPTVIDTGMLAITKMVGLIGAIELITALSSRLGMVKNAAGDPVKGGGMFGSLMGATIAIVALSGALALLSLIPTEDLQGASTALVIASLAVIALSFAVQKMSSAVDIISKGSVGFVTKVANIGTTVLALIALLGAVVGFFLAYKLVAGTIVNMEYKDLAIFASGLVAITVLLAVIDRIPSVDSGFKRRLQGLGTSLLAVIGLVAATALFFGAFASVSGIIKNIDEKDFAKFAIALGLVTGVMSAISLLSAGFIALGGGWLPALVGIGIALLATGVVVLAVSGLAILLNSMYKDHGPALTKGLDFLVEIGSGLGRFIGAFLAGTTTGALESVAHSIVAFITAFDGVSFDALDGFGKLAAAILIITATSVLDGVNSLKNLISGQSTMERFASQISDFVLAIQEVSPADAAKASIVMRALRPMVDALGEVATAAKDIPNSGGFLGAFMGDNDIDTFGTMLVDFIKAFTDVTPDQATHTKDVLASMKDMVENLKDFADAAKDIPNSGGFLGEFMGDNDIDTFGTMLADFVKAFIGVTPTRATRSSDVLAAMKPMADNLKEFATAAEKIPSTGGFLDVFLGNSDLPTFSGHIKGLIDTFGSVNILQLSTATSTLKLMGDFMIPALIKFSDLASGLDDSGGVKQFFTGNTTLSEFGTQLAKFVEKISGIDFSNVGPAMAAMNKITTSFKIVGAKVLENAKKSFENNKEPFQTAIATILEAPIAKLESQKTALSTTISAIVKNVTDKSPAYVEDFKKLGANLIDGLKSGIESKKRSAITSIEKVMSAVVSAANATVSVASPSRVFETIGSWCTKGLANGLTKETDVAVAAGVNMAKATEGGVRDALGVHSLSELFAKIGGWLPKSLGEGIQNGKDALLGQAGKLGIDTGNLTLNGIITSVTGGEGALTSGITSLLDLLTGTSSDSAIATGTDIGNILTGGFQDSLTNSTTGLGGSSTKAAVKSELDKLKEIIEERSFYGKITIEEELAMYQTLRAAYKQGSEERKQIDREIYTRLKTIYDAQISYIESVEKAQRDANDERAKADDTYYRGVEAAEADAAKRLATIKETYEKDSIQAKFDADEKRESQEKSYHDRINSLLENAEKERQQIREQYASNQKSINAKLLSDIASQNKAYDDAVKSRADSIYNSYNLFSAVEQDPEVTGDELLKNLQDQGAALSEWKQSLSELAGRGVGDTLIEELQAMGPSSKAQIKALITLTDEQLTEYVGLFEGKYTFARVKAEDELEGLRDSTSQTIQELNNQAAIDLNNLELEFSTSMSAINNNMAAEMTDLRTTHDTTMAQIRKDLEDKLNEIEHIWKTSSEDVQTELTGKLDELETTYDDALNKINSELKKDLEEMQTKFSSTMKEINGLTETELRKLIGENKTKLAQLNTETSAKLDELKNTYDTSGNKIVSSFGSTLKNIIPNTTSTINNLIGTIKNSFNSAVSDFELAGHNAAAGFARGIREGAYLARTAAEYLAHAAVLAAERILEEKSPSRVFAGIGEFVSRGFANGIADNAKLATKASEEMARGPIAAVSRALAEMEESDDWSFTITPVLDLSNIHAGNIAQLLGAPVNLGTTSRRLANETIQNGNREASSTTSIVNKFDLTGLTVRTDADVDAIATKLYQKQQTALRGRGIRGTGQR